MASVARLAMPAFRSKLATSTPQVARRFAHSTGVNEVLLSPLFLSMRLLTFAQHLPFDYTNKRSFAIKAVAYMGTGFSIPFIAIWWQWSARLLLRFRLF